MRERRRAEILLFREPFASVRKAAPCAQTADDADDGSARLLDACRFNFGTNCRRRLFLAQRDHWIYVYCPSRGDIGAEQRYGRKDYRD